MNNGSLQAFAAGFLGEASWAKVWGGFVLPSVIGNVLGGVTLMVALNHAQVVSEEKETGF